MPFSETREDRHQKLYRAWLETLTPEQRQKHEEGAARAAANIVQVDIRWQYNSKRKKRMPCECCGVPVTYCGVFPFGPDGGIRWYVSEDHVAPCGRICLLSSEASHFGGQTMRAFADSPDCHRGRFCECQKGEEQVQQEAPKNRLRIPVHPSRRKLRRT